MNKKRAIIVGCGYGGLAAARELAANTAPDLEVTVFNRTPVLYNYPVLPRLLLNGVADSEIDRPLSTLLDTTAVTLHTQRVESIDLPNRQLATESDTFEFDYLILAPGGRAIPIDQEDGFMVYYPKAARHLIRLREELKTLCAQSPLPDRGHRFAIVGGGLTGVEFAASLRFATNRLCTAHGRNPQSVAVTLLEQRDRIAPNCHPRLSRRLTQQLVRINVGVETGCRVERIAFDHLQTTAGNIPADRVLCCIGSRPDLRLSLNGFSATDKGLPVTPTLQLSDAENVFIVGDAAYSDAPLHQETKRAIHAKMQGRAAAHNLLRLSRGETPRVYMHPSLPALVSLGLDYALLEYRGWCVGGALTARLKHYLETRA